MPLQEFDFATGKVLDPKRKQAIVVTADDAGVAVLRESLEAKRFQFLGHRTDIREALELVRKHKVGLLFLDADLDGVDVKTLLPSIKKAYAGFNVIVMTGQATKEMLSEVLRLGAAGFLLKPLEGDAVAKVLAKIK